MNINVLERENYKNMNDEEKLKKLEYEYHSLIIAYQELMSDSSALKKQLDSKSHYFNGLMKELIVKNENISKLTHQNNQISDMLSSFLKIDVASIFKNK